MPEIAKKKPFEGGDTPAGHKARELNRTFFDLNRKFEEEGVQRQAKRINLPYFNLFGFPISEEALRTVPEDEARKAQLIPFFKEKEILKIGAVDSSSEEIRGMLKRLSQKNFKPELYLISKSALVESLKQYKKILTEEKPLKAEIVVEASRKQAGRFRALPDLGVKLSRVSATEFLELIIGSAIYMRASDIHLEPEEKFLKVRFRIDGVIQDGITLPISLWKKILTRIKLVSDLKLNITSAPQEGRTNVLLKGEESVDLRISVLPTGHGESVVMRILGLREISLQMEDLGMSEGLVKIMSKELSKRSGMILTTGPTGSGKTTSLYTFLSYLNKTGTKIVTIEDPIEYQLEGIIQTPIDRKKGVDFASSLRAIVRQDPDIIMIGEIRDQETASTAVQASLTGHMVLSTMHTNDSSGAIPRLLDFGVKPATLAPAINALMAQRLLRRICEHCKEVYKPGQPELARVKQILSKVSPSGTTEVPELLIFYHSRGCKECHDLGYKGRIGIFEAFLVDEEIERLIYDQALSVDIKKAAIKAGMLTLQQAAVLKAIAGITDLAEVWRVTGE